MTGPEAYREDVLRKPEYEDGRPRPPWEQLCPVAQWSWIRNPTPRVWGDVTELTAVN